MKRKIAAILIADIAGYSKLVADDDEQTARRLSSYRALFEDFITRFSGRVVNAVGDSLLAEFPSAVEAVRCAIDVQESLRTQNLAYPSSRQMNCRIGVTIGDVVERDDVVMGDGVNIAARLEGLAPPGGVCVSHAVYEQVRNKMSVRFVDIGERSVKNIPFPVHAYTLALSPVAEYVQDLHRRQKSMKRSPWKWPVAIVVAGAALLATAVLLTEAGPRTGGSETALPAASAQAQTQAQTLGGRQGGGTGPCAQLKTVCEQAGFQEGAAGTGNGVWMDCIIPILRASAQRPQASKPLPKADAKIVAACKTIMKNIGPSLGPMFQIQ